MADQWQLANEPSLQIQLTNPEPLGVTFKSNLWWLYN